jgi:hypothetical protein
MSNPTILNPVLKPSTSSIQFGDLLGNIAHTGTLGSNINLTTPLTSTFPTTSTGDSLGHYHYTEATTNALQFLNASGSGTGGHKFYTSNSTTAPIETATFDINGMTIDKSTAGLPILINLPDLTISTDVVVVFATPINQAPWNIVGVGNPVQVLQNTANMQTGITYYLTGLSTQLGQLTTNSDGTGIIDCTDLITLPQPILSWESGQFSPSTIQTINLLDNMTITTDTDVSVLSATDLTFNTVSLQETLTTLQITKTTSSNQYISAVIYADARPPTAPTTTITQQFGYTPAWFFKNSFASGINKINWYLAGDIGMQVSQVLGLYMNIFNPSMTSNDNCPFIVIMTTNDTPNPPNYYKSKRTYIFNQSITPVVNTRYCMFSNVSGTCPTPFHYASVLNNMELSTVAGSNVGAFAPTEVILAFSIHTNSASAINSVEFALSKFGIMTPYGTQEILFIPS